MGSVDGPEQHPDDVGDRRRIAVPGPDADGLEPHLGDAARGLAEGREHRRGGRRDGLRQLIAAAEGRTAKPRISSSVTGAGVP